MGWLWILAALSIEAAGVIAAKYVHKMSKNGSIAVIAGCFAGSVAAFVGALQTVDLFVAFGLWAGAGTLLHAALGMCLVKDRMTLVKMISFRMAMIGAVGLQLDGYAVEAGVL